MKSPETLAPLEEQNFAEQDQSPIERKSFENLKRFLAEGAIAPVRIYPSGEKPDYSDKRIYYPSVGKLTSLEEGERDLRMTYDYVFGEETHEQIAKRNGNLTRQAVQIIINRTVKGLHEGADEAARDRFAFESFDFAKPRTLSSRQRSSEARGGISLGIARKLDEGATPDELKKIYTTHQIWGKRRTVESWGYTLEREKPLILPQFEGLGNLDATDHEIQTLFDKISYISQYQVLKQAGIVVDLSTVAKKAGLYISSDQVYFISESLRKELLPQTKVAHKIKDKNGQEKTVYYHIIAATDEENAIDILRNDRNLDDLRINPVSQIAGPTREKLPNTTMLRSEEYGSVGSLIAEIIGSRWNGIKSGIKTADIIKGSPVGIYRNSNTSYYRKSQEETLRNHLESRLRTLAL